MVLCVCRCLSDRAPSCCTLSAQRIGVLPAANHHAVHGSAAGRLDVPPPQAALRPRRYQRGYTPLSIGLLQTIMLLFIVFPHSRTLYFFPCSFILWCFPHIRRVTVLLVYSNSTLVFDNDLPPHPPPPSASPSVPNLVSIYSVSVLYFSKCLSPSSGCFAIGNSSLWFNSLQC